MAQTFIRFFIVCLTIAWGFSTHAMDTPINAGGTTVPSLTVTNYSPIFGNRLNWSATETGVRSIIPAPGTFKSFYAGVAVAPAVGKSWTFTLIKNGSATGITCQIVDAATTCSDLLRTFSVVAGDSVTIQAVPSGTPTAPTNIRFSITFEGGTNVSVILGGLRSTTLSTGTTDYLALQGLVSPASTIAGADQIFPTNTVLSSLWVETNGVAGTGASYDFTLTKNGVDQTLTCQVAGASIQVCSDTTHSVSVSAGDRVSLKSVPAGTPTTRLVRWGVMSSPTIDGESVLMMSQAGNLNTGGSIRFTSVYGTNQAWQSTEASMQNLGGVYSLRKMWADLDAAPGGATNYTFTTRINGANGTNSVQISGASTQNSDLVHTDSIVGFDLIDFASISGGGTPATTAGRVSIVSYIAPPATPTPTPTATPTSGGINGPLGLLGVGR